LSIKPQYVDQILTGKKRYELRRVIFTQSIHTVIIYASSPVQKVVGEFIVEVVHTLPPSTLWRLVMAEAGIDEDRFKSYFDGCRVGHAIEIASVVEYPEPLPIDTFTTRPPQNFIYLR